MTTSAERSPGPSVHVVILAAGRGTRLGALGSATPKWLLQVGDATLADRHLEAIRDASDVASVVVVTGHAAPAIEHELALRRDHVRTVHVAEYEVRNNWWSLLSALRTLPDAGPVVVLNADLCADPEALTSFLDVVSAGEADGVLAIDFERELTAESMKVSQAPEGHLEAIGKVAVEPAVGEYVGILMARGRALAALRETLEGFVDRADASDQWYEGAVGRVAADGVAWELWPMPSSGWVEIDDDADLDSAQALVGGR